MQINVWCTILPEIGVIIWIGRGGAEGHIMRATTLFALSEDQSIQGTLFDEDAKLFE
jgi:hypothetical protein